MEQFDLEQQLDTEIRLLDDKVSTQEYYLESCRDNYNKIKCFKSLDHDELNKILEPFIEDGYVNWYKVICSCVNGD